MIQNMKHVVKFEINIQKFQRKILLRIANMKSNINGHIEANIQIQYITLIYQADKSLRTKITVGELSSHDTK